MTEEERLIEEARYESRFFAFNASFALGGCELGPDHCLKFAKLFWELSEVLAQKTNANKDRYWTEFGERLNKMSEGIQEVVVSEPPQDSDFPEGFPENMKDILKNCARVRSICKHLKDLSSEFDEAYSLDLNPHLTIEFIVSEISKRVNSEGHCPETTAEEVMVMWLTELHLMKGRNRLAEEPPKYLPNEDEDESTE